MMTADAVNEHEKMPPRPTLRASGALRPAAASHQELKLRLHGKLVDLLQPQEVERIPEDRRRAELHRIVEHLVEAEAGPLSYVDRRLLTEELLDEALGLGPLEKLLKDPTISDILINGPRKVWVERHGQLERGDIAFRNDAHLLQIIDRIVSKVGRRVDEMSPMVDARLPDGSRVNAVIPPISLRGPALSIRRFGLSPLQAKDLLRLKSLAPEMLTVLDGAVKARLNILVSGGTGSGKTTLLNVLSSFIPNTHRLVSIEDAAELQLQQPHVVQLEARPANIEGKGAVTIRDLVRNALRMRPDRIIVGEVPRRRSPGHAASDEHRPRRLDDDVALQRPARRPGPAGDDDDDVGPGTAAEGDAPDDRLVPPSHRPGRSRSWWGAKGDEHYRSDRHGR